MARPREFDESEVLDRALETFWEKGYDGTSIQDLLDATGLGRASLYGAFGDKERLYQRVLDRYIARLNAGAAADTSGSAREVLERLFDGWVGATCPKSGPRGCFLLVAGMAGDESQFARDALAASLRHMEKLLADVIKRGQASGEIARDRDPTVLARLLVITVQGIAAAARVGWGQDRLRSVVNEAISQVIR